MCGGILGVEIWKNRCDFVREKKCCVEFSFTLTPLRVNQVITLVKYDSDGVLLQHTVQQAGRFGPRVMTVVG